MGGRKNPVLNGAFLLIVFYIFPVIAMMFLVMCHIAAFCVLLFIFSAVQLILVLRTRNMTVLYRFVLIVCIASASFHN